MKLLNPPVLKYAYVCSDHFTDEDYVRNHTLQSGLLQSTVNKVLKRDAFLEGLGTCEIGVHNLSHFFKKRNSHNDSWMLRVIPRLKRYKTTRIGGRVKSKQTEDVKEEESPEMNSKV